MNCSMFAKDGKTRCEGHNRTYDCMMYQANKDGELETLEKVLGDPEKEFTAMSNMSLDDQVRRLVRGNQRIGPNAVRARLNDTGIKVTIRLYEQYHCLWVL